MGGIHGNKEDCQYNNPYSLKNPAANDKKGQKRPDNGKISQRLICIR